jgi:phosphatidylserine/phosphatidylglycerophosphate/cardiolipin synthase-like enzyme
MNKAVFTSVDGGDAHRSLIIQEIEDASAQSWQSGRLVRLDIMCFAFTDKLIRDALLEFLDVTPKAEIRILADWGQGSFKSPSVIRGLEELARDDLQVRIKADAPYFQDADTGDVRWGYTQSHGMLHHKTMGVVFQGVTERIVLGSFNWSTRGSQAYENTMVLQRSFDTAPTLDAFGQEFDALWLSDIATMPISASSDFAKKARALAADGADLKEQSAIETLIGGSTHAQEPANSKTVQDQQIIPAFSGRYMNGLKPHYGFSPLNAANKIDLLRPSGVRKTAPVTINSIALEAIRSVPAGHTIDVAMYAMSPRVPEFTALIEAAKRGCKLRVILDGKLGKSMATRLARHATDKDLPIEVCITNRRMHQKYLVAAMDDIVLTGTANMTEEASDRHADHRLLFRNSPEMAASFANDFETIWQRVDK